MTNTQNMTHDEMVDNFVDPASMPYILESEYGPMREVGPNRWRFSVLANAETFGSLIVEAPTYMDAVYAAADALDTEQAFWKS